MRALDNHSLLGAWDHGSNQSPLGRALTMLASASPQRRGRELMSLPIQERDRELLELRRAMFGDKLRGFVACTACGTSLEVEVEVTSLLDRLESARPEAAEREIGGCVISMRQATSEDLAAAVAIGELGAARRVLLERCATLRPGGSLTDELEEAAVELFEALHQNVEIVFSLSCPSCGGTQKSELDIGQFLWKELSGAGLSLLREVHELARVYGWSEESILGMSPVRRAYYLDLVRP